MVNKLRRKFLSALAGSTAGLALLTTWLYNRKNVSQVSLASLDTDERFDVCIAGSGPAGAILARELVRRGIKTLILEAGGVRDETFEGKDLRFKGSRDALSQEISYPVDSTRYIAIGGTSNLWGGFCPRLHPLDFRGNSYSPRNEPWPVIYKELEPYYTRAEQELHVRGGDPSQYSPPRQKPYPLTLHADSGVGQLSEFLKKAGYVIEPPPLSDWNGRPINVAESHLPSYRQSSLGKLVRDARVTRILPAGNGTISGFQVQSVDGMKKLISSRFYVLACGGIETPRLLSLSRSREFPRGIGNEYDLVGRHFMEHLQLGAKGWKEEGERESDNATFFDAAQGVEAISWQFYEEFKSSGLGGIIMEFGMPKSGDGWLRLSPILEMEPSPWNRVVLDEERKDSFGNPTARVVLKVSERDAETIKRARTLMTNIFSDVGMRSIEMSGRINMNHHHIGTCRMASDPRAGVVDGNLKVHGTDNLYVAGSASFVTSGASAPTLSIVALSLRLADHLVEKLQGAKTAGKLFTAAGHEAASES